MSTFYHFTSRLHLPVILESGYLKTTDSNLDSGYESASPRCVWLLDTPDVNGYDHGLGGGLSFKKEIRFSVEVPDRRVLKWVDWAMANGIDRHWFDTLVGVGGGIEAAEHWRCVFRRIPREDWLGVDRLMSDGSWQRVDLGD